MPLFIRGHPDSMCSYVHWGGLSFIFKEHLFVWLFWCVHLCGYSVCTYMRVHAPQFSFVLNYFHKGTFKHYDEEVWVILWNPCSLYFTSLVSHLWFPSFLFFSLATFPGWVSALPVFSLSSRSTMQLHQLTHNILTTFTRQTTPHLIIFQEKTIVGWGCEIPQLSECLT